MACMFKGDALRVRSALVAALEDFRLVAHFLLQHEPSNLENESFFCTLIVRCMDFQQLLNGKSDSNSIRGLIYDALDRFESSIVVPSASCTSQNDGRRTNPGLENLHRVLATRFDDTQSKLEALRACVVFGDKEKQSALLELLSKGCTAARSETQTEILESELATPRKRRQLPRDDIRSAAHSLFEVLRAKHVCTCEPAHKYVVQLSLGTHRAQVTSCDFDLYFGLDKTWQEARVQTEALSHSGFPSISIQHHTKAEGNDTSMGDEVERRLVRKLCRDIIKTTRRLPDHRLNFALEKDSLWKLQSKASEFVIDKSKPPISLAQLLADDLTLLNERVKRILSVLLGYAVLHLHDTLWLSSTWGSENVMFFRSSAGLPMRPYIRTTLDEHGATDHFSSAQADDEDEEDSDPDDMLFHTNPCLVGLAVVLMEVHNAAPLEILAKRYGVELRDLEDPEAPLINAGMILKKCEHNFTEQTKLAIEACLDPSLIGSKEDIQSVIYRRIVLPLEDELEQGFSELLVDELDSLVQDLDLANGGRRTLGINTPIVTTTNTLARSVQISDSSRRVRFEDSTNSEIVRISQNTPFPPTEGNTLNDQRQSSGKQIERPDKTVTLNPAYIEASQSFVVPTVSKLLPDSRPNTLRIMNIPDETSTSELSMRLEQLFAWKCKIHSLARASRDARWKKHATVTFPGLPNPTLVEAVAKLQLQDLDDHLEFDTSFQGLTPLYDSGHSAIVDIVAIEGLGTNPFGTFRAPQGNLMWLRDFLPRSFPSCRVLLYGYDSKVPGSMSNQSVPEIASTCKNIVTDFRELTKTDERPIIWLGQSMGGLIVQEVLVQARQHRAQKTSGSLSDHSIGFIGYGVPMKGLQHESLLNAVRKQPNFGMIQSICLEGDRPSRYLEDLANRFALCKERLSIYHFYETNPSQDIWNPEAIPQRKVDDQGVVGHKDSYWVPRNHSELVKVSDTTDFVYTTTIRNISLILNRHLPSAYS